MEGAWNADTWSPCNAGEVWGGGGGDGIGFGSDGPGNIDSGGGKPLNKLSSVNNKNKVD